jgi:hypothetical protein
MQSVPDQPTKLVGSIRCRSISGRLRNVCTTLSRNLTERDRFGEDIDIDGKMTFKMGIKYIPCGYADWITQLQHRV